MFQKEVISLRTSSRLNRKRIDGKWGGGMGGKSFGSPSVMADR